MAAFVGRLLATIARIFQRDTREKRDALSRRAAKVTNFDALMNAGLNVPGSLTRRIGAKSEGKEAAASTRRILPAEKELHG